MDNGFDIFIDRISENQRSIVYFLHEQFMAYPAVQYKTRFKIPFYYYNSWLCYLNSIKNDKIELCFINGQIMADPPGIMETRGRKKISGIMLTDVDTIPLEGIMELFSEAIFVDKENKKRKK